MTAITKVMNVHKPDGLYFDGQYTSNPAALYALARRTRELIGEDGILEWHSTTALGNGHCYLPQADAYVDFILRGEGRESVYEDFEYLRYFVSFYNINNCIGVLCNNGPIGVNPNLVRDVLRANRALSRHRELAGKPNWWRVLEEEYFPKLNPALQNTGRRSHGCASETVWGTGPRPCWPNARPCWPNLDGTAPGVSTSGIPMPSNRSGDGVVARKPGRTVHRGGRADPERPCQHVRFSQDPCEH